VSVYFVVVNRFDITIGTAPVLFTPVNRGSIAFGIRFPAAAVFAEHLFARCAVKGESLLQRLHFVEAMPMRENVNGGFGSITWSSD